MFHRLFHGFHSCCSRNPLTPLRFGRMLANPLSAVWAQSGLGATPLRSTDLQHGNPALVTPVVPCPGSLPAPACGAMIPCGKAPGAARGGSRRRSVASEGGAVLPADDDIEPQFTEAAHGLVGPLPSVGEPEGLPHDPGAIPARNAPFRGHSRGCVRTNEGHSPPLFAASFVHPVRDRPRNPLAPLRFVRILPNRTLRLGAESGAGSDPSPIDGSTAPKPAASFAGLFVVRGRSQPAPAAQWIPAGRRTARPGRVKAAVLDADKGIGAPLTEAALDLVGQLPDVGEPESLRRAGGAEAQLRWDRISRFPCEKDSCVARLLCGR